MLFRVPVITPKLRPEAMFAFWPTGSVEIETGVLLHFDADVGARHDLESGLLHAQRFTRGVGIDVGDRDARGGYGAAGGIANLAGDFTEGLAESESSRQQSGAENVVNT